MNWDLTAAAADAAIHVADISGAQAAEGSAAIGDVGKVVL